MVWLTRHVKQRDDDIWEFRYNVISISELLFDKTTHCDIK